jgi:hypothetical protein
MILTGMAFGANLLTLYKLMFDYRQFLTIRQLSLALAKWPLLNGVVTYS